MVHTSPFSSTHCIFSLPIKINFYKVITDYLVVKSNGIFKIHTFFHYFIIEIVTHKPQFIFFYLLLLLFLLCQLIFTYLIFRFGILVHRSTNHGPPIKSSLLPDFVNKVNQNHSHAHSFMYFLSFFFLLSFLLFFLACFSCLLAFLSCLLFFLACFLPFFLSFFFFHLSTYLSFFFFLRPHLQHMEIPRQRVE